MLQEEQGQLVGAVRHEAGARRNHPSAAAREARHTAPAYAAVAYVGVDNWELVVADALGSQGREVDSWGCLHGMGMLVERCSEGMWEFHLAHTEVCSLLSLAGCSYAEG